VSAVARELAVLLQQQVLMVSATAGAAADGDPAAAQAWAAQLTGRHAEALTALTGSIYPDAETADVVALVRDAAPPLLDYVGGSAAEGDPATAEAARERLDDLVVEAGAVLERVTGLPAKDGRERVGAHLEALLALADAHLAGDADTAYGLQRETTANVDELVRVVAETIGVQQGYEAGGGAVLAVATPATAEGLRAALPLLFAERAWLQAQATDAAVRSDTDELAAVRGVLDALDRGNGSELGAAVGAVVGAVGGPSVADEFASVLGARTDLLVRLGQASVPPADAAARDQLRAELATNGRAFAAVLVGLTEGSLPQAEGEALVSELLDAQIEAVDARASGDATRAASAAGLAASRAGALGSRVAEGLIASSGIG